jgi:hypothetical protein
MEIEKIYIVWGCVQPKFYSPIVPQEVPQKTDSKCLPVPYMQLAATASLYASL